MPAILASLLIVFALSIDDFVVTQYMSSNSATTTIPMFLYANARGGTSTPALNALATMLVVMMSGRRRRSPTSLYTILRRRTARRRLGAARAVGDRSPHEPGGSLMPGEVELRALTKRYDESLAVDAIDATINAGEFFSLLGPSGCGKTTTLRMIAGFERPTAGEILLDGDDVAQVPPHERNVHTVFQNYALFPHLSVFDNVAFGLQAAAVPEGRAAPARQGGDRAGRAEGYGERRPHQLSGGQQQRVALARALVLQPAVLLLDEPLGALDAKIRKQLRIELKALQEQVGITFVFVTHDQEEALTMSDRVAVMTKGRIEQIGTPADVYEDPATVFVADFLGVSNLMDADRGRRSDRRLHGRGRRLRAARRLR